MRRPGWAALQSGTPGKNGPRPWRPGPIAQRIPYGVGSAKLPPKMSELPNVAGQSTCGAGRGTEVSPVRSAILQASRAGQSAAFRVSFHTAAAYPFVATAYT